MFAVPRSIARSRAIYSLRFLFASGAIASSPARKSSIDELKLVFLSRVKTQMTNVPTTKTTAAAPRNNKGLIGELLLHQVVLLFLECVVVLDPNFPHFPRFLVSIWGRLTLMCQCRIVMLRRRDLCAVNLQR